MPSYYELNRERLLNKAKARYQDKKEQLREYQKNYIREKRRLAKEQRQEEVNNKNEEVE